ncbi:MAG: rod shape-determining protein RodA [Gammaproteobacteria bacterium]|jgi:rod shape determining protein RodA|nr:rod shape-determining protein RodA [Gammaproteobacteria bacterium]|tara:strand:- start:1296 stop:2435 length:1140 start_codon:yes stop_codon:yes gene_type:complete
MSQDFVRRMPSAGFGQTRTVGLGEKFHLDIPIILLLVMICAYGLLILYSAVGQQTAPVVNQLIKIGVAFGLMIVMAQISPIFYLRIAPWLFVMGIVLLIAVLFVGTTVNGSQRWLRIPGVLNFQPSELMKLVIPMMLASYFHDRHLPPLRRHVFWACVMIFIPVLLIARQPDLGTSLLIGASGLLVLLLAGISWRYVFSAVLAGLMAAPALWYVMLDYQRTRVMILLDPERDPLGAGWNIIQSKTAIGSGGLFGKGLFQGTQSHLDFLPESQTDFIVAVLAEELGLVGVTLLLILYILLVGRGVVIAIQAQDTFGRLLVGTITFTFFVYVFVNIGMVSGILPVVGVPLPLVSHGGTAILTLFAGFGIIMSVHTHRRITL